MYIKSFENYNNNTLNELINKYYNDESESIIEILDSYDHNLESAKNILEKIAFIIEGGEVILTTDDNGNIMYYVSQEDENKKTFFYSKNEHEFFLKSLNEF